MGHNHDVNKPQHDCLEDVLRSKRQAKKTRKEKELFNQIKEFSSEINKGIMHRHAHIWGMEEDRGCTRKIEGNAGAAAALYVSETLGDFDIPGTVRTRSTKMDRSAGHGGHGITDGTLTVEVDIKPYNGIVQTIEIPVYVKNGYMTQPGLMYHKGSPYVIAQSSLNEVIDYANVHHEAKTDRKNLYCTPYIQPKYASILNSENLNMRNDDLDNLVKELAKYNPNFPELVKQAQMKKKAFNVYFVDKRNDIELISIPVANDIVDVIGRYASAEDQIDLAEDNNSAYVPGPNGSYLFIQQAQAVDPHAKGPNGDGQTYERAKSAIESGQLGLAYEAVKTLNTFFLALAKDSLPMPPPEKTGKLVDMLKAEISTWNTAVEKGPQDSATDNVSERPSSAMEEQVEQEIKDAIDTASEVGEDEMANTLFELFNAIMSNSSDPMPMWNALPEELKELLPMTKQYIFGKEESQPKETPKNTRGPRGPYRSKPKTKMRHRM